MADDARTMASRPRRPREQLCSPVPVTYLNAVLESFWGEYVCRRRQGMDADRAVMDALQQLLPADQLVDVEQMLSGDLDDEFSIGAPFDGRMILHDLIDTGDRRVREGTAAGGGPPSRPPGAGGSVLR